MRILNIRNLAVVGVFLAAFAAVWWWGQTPRLPVTTLNSVDMLQQQFEQDTGTPRLVLLVSPT
jgi:hypothetical protein